MGLTKASDRPTWEQVFIDLAYKISERSHDEQTKHGCVIVRDNNTVVSMGYNGFPRNIDDRQLPTIRPHKYDYMLHAELNAILNANASLEDCVAYVTGIPCLHCLMCLHQKGIKKVVYGDRTFAALKNSLESIKTMAFLCNIELVHHTKKREINNLSGFHINQEYRSVVCGERPNAS
jgi:dCMP deaminase